MRPDSRLNATLLSTSVVMAVIAMAFLVGCADDAHVLSLSSDGQYLAPQTGPGLVARPDSPIPDLPMPIGFKTVVAQSRVETRGEFRYVRHVYQGRSSMADAMQFFRQNAPHHGWRPIGEQADGAQSLMWFTKGPERLTLKLSRRGGIVSTAVWITDQQGF